MTHKSFVSLLVLLLFCNFSFCQQLTGVWKGRINNSRVELKLVQNGDSITGTSYYHGLLNNYSRYTIKGYFDQYSNSVVWWDDEFVSSKGPRTSEKELLSVADFDCPGGGRMYLDGKASPKETKGKPNGIVTLSKGGRPSFKDEWDEIIETYNQGGNDPELIDSVSKIALARKPKVDKPVAVKKPDPVQTTPTPPVAKVPVVQKPEPPVAIVTAPVKPLTIDEMFTSRKKVFNSEIPLKGDSIELRFYDNAEVDGDSISLYLNDKMIFTHVRLTGNAYIIKFPVKELKQDNELVMVAENLGSIPPNTSYMIAIVGDKRYEAQLESTEKSSSLIRLSKSVN